LAVFIYDKASRDAGKRLRKQAIDTSELKSEISHTGPDRRLTIVRKWHRTFHRAY
jgi:hypothetical protein